MVIEMFFDTHCHLYKEYYKDISEVINRALDNNILGVINSGCDDATNKEIIEILSKYNNMYAVIGIHPENVLSYKEEDISYLINNLSNKKVIGIGEIGLDYYWTKETIEEQKALFIRQLKIAEKYNLPVVVHSREATKDTYDILSKFNVKGVIHSFSGSLETAQKYIKLGYLLGINGVITFKNCKIKDVYKNIPLENIILETDSPYLTPEPKRGTKNEPANIKEIAQFVSEIYGITLEELAKVTNDNIKRIFDI